MNTSSRNYESGDLSHVVPPTAWHKSFSVINRTNVSVGEQKIVPEIFGRVPTTLYPSMEMTPDELIYIPLKTVVRASSGIIFLLALSSFLLGLVSGFQMLHPLIAVIALLASTLFFAMSYTGGRDI
jgi:hypothetical protein